MFANHSSSSQRSGKMRLALAAFLVAGLCAIGPGASAQTREASLGTSATQADAGADYRLGTGDKVRIVVFNQRELTDVYQVDGTGRITVPLIGQIQATGLTPKQLESRLIHALSPDYVKNPHVSVVVLTARPFYILGEVTKPGSYPYISGMTVLTAAAQAGGFTYRANEDSFDLERPNGSGGKRKIDAKPDTPIEPGDVIKVNERFF